MDKKLIENTEVLRATKESYSSLKEKINPNKYLSSKAYAKKTSIKTNEIEDEFLASPVKKTKYLSAKDFKNKLNKK